MFRRIGLVIALLGVLLFGFDLTIALFSAYTPIRIGDFLGFIGIYLGSSHIAQVFGALPLNMVLVIIGVVIDFVNRLWWEFQVARITREVRAERRKLGDPE
ncbi:hypothetical protein [Zavarzinia sp. CC-PAN008]|uniref:hypothetical protein n=1 Tax=Zavarzinia sp. CC-PAN008 TaxID=3243332 RepID=UPI003F74822D